MLLSFCCANLDVDRNASFRQPDRVGPVVRTKSYCSRAVIDLLGENVQIRHGLIVRTKHSSAATTLMNLNLSSSEVAEPDRDKAVAVLIQDASAGRGERKQEI